MNGITDEVLDYFESVIDGKISTAMAKVTRTHHKGNVLYTDDEGTTWVEIPGMANAIPVDERTVNFSDGDSVTISIENGYAILDGNLEDPAVTSITCTEIINNYEENLIANINDLDEVYF